MNTTPIGTLSRYHEDLIEMGYPLRSLPKKFKKGDTVWYFITIQDLPFKTALSQTTILDDGTDERYGWSYMCEGFDGQLTQIDLFESLAEARNEVHRVYSYMIGKFEDEINDLKDNMNRLLYFNIQPIKNQE